MTKNEFRQALKRNRLTCDQFAALIGRHVKTVYEYGAGASVPYYARLLLRLLDERGGAHGLLQRPTGFRIGNDADGKQ